ncbi:copper radical oxidase [Ramaria rubella]|nr:copper radical oxidase [Ramaria rubella]
MSFLCNYYLLLGFFLISSTLAQNDTCNAAAPPTYFEPASAGVIPQPFLPYFSPNGTTSFDDSDTSGSVTYKGAWRAVKDQAAVNSTLHVTTDTSASVSFTFTGTGIEWFGTIGSNHGIAKVRVRPPIEKEVNGFSATPFEQQRLFGQLNLPLGKYKITIQNTKGGRNGQRLDVDAFVVTNKPSFVTPDGRVSSAGGWNLVQKGFSGVGGMQLTMISTTHALIFDRTSHNYASINGHPAWSVIYDLTTDELQPKLLSANSICASGSFLSNGTLISVGGTRGAVNDTNNDEYHDTDGRETIRVLEPCNSPTAAGCNLLEMDGFLSANRWYATTLRVSDGSVLIIGGGHEIVFMNNITVNEPTTTFFPSRSRQNYPVDFLNRTLNANLFPHAFSLPNQRAFIISNTESIFYNWGANPPVEEASFPLPNGIRVNYPMPGTSILLPLSSQDNYTARIIVCGGSDAPDRLCDFQYSAQHPASNQCSRIEIKRDGTTDGWKLDDPMLDGARVMPDSVLLPTGEMIIVNGARTGYSGYGSVIDPIGLSNADDPALSPLMYSPDAAPGHRFSQLPVKSDIPRLYHSVASLTPNGDIMILGSNPNIDRSLQKFPSEYRVEWLRPPYMSQDRPTYTGLKAVIGYGTTFTLNVQISSSLDKSKIKVALMDLGFATHSTHANARLVYLDAVLSGKKLTITAPPDAGVYPPGPGYIFVVVDGIASKAANSLIGDGKPPPIHP